MIDPITEIILQGNEEKLLEDSLDTILEGYNLQCQQCGRVITIVKDGTGPLECCSRRMIVMGGSPEDPAEDIEEVRKTLKGQVVDPDFQVPVGSVNFSPYNQTDAQKKAEKGRIKQESQLVKDMEVFQEVGEQMTISRMPQPAKYRPYITKQARPRERVPRKPLTKPGDLKISSMREAGFETKPKGWTDASVKKFGKSLVKGGGKKEGFFKKCVKKMEGKVANPEGFCAAVKDEAHDSTYWRGKGKSPQEVGKDIKKHKNV